MKKAIAKCLAVFLSAWIASAPSAHAYTMDYVTPASGGCPLPIMQDVMNGASISRRWSTELLYPPTIITVSEFGSPDQLSEIQDTIVQSYDTWAGVTGTFINSNSYPHAFAPIQQTTVQNACTDDAMDNVDGINTICFSQSSDAFVTGVLSFTEVIAVDAPGITVGEAGPSVFAGQILDADILFCPTGQVTFATPGALPQSPGSYDLESLLIHEIGSQLGLDYSGLWRSAMFPFPPPPGTYLGIRPTNLTPDAPLADDDRAGLRTLYADGSDTMDIGIVSGHLLPANPFELATLPLSSPGVAVSGVISAQVVAADAVTGEILAATLGGWSCSPATGIPIFDGFYALQHLPLNRNYNIYAEPLIGPLAPEQFANVTAGLCNIGGVFFCTPPPADTNLSARFQPASSP
jgi:hypothetical protein